MNIKVKKLISLKQRTLGLIGAEKPYPISFKTRFGIHTFGLNFPIDVLILDKNNKVFSIRRNLLPNRIYVWNPKFDTVIELPVGFVSSSKIKIGEKISLIERS